MRNLNVFSLIAVLVLVFVIGCSFTPINHVDKDVEAVVENTVEFTQSDNKTSISSAVFINPDLLIANEPDGCGTGDVNASQTSSAVFLNPELAIANN